MARTQQLGLSLGLAFALGAGAAEASPELRACLDAQRPVRVARVLDASAAPRWVRVLAHDQGVPVEVAPIESAASDLASVFEGAAQLAADAPRWAIAPSELTGRVCAPLDLTQRALDTETHVAVAAGLNYAAHAEEAGGGDVFVFPKPVEPGAPYGTIAPPTGVTLLDYEVELGFVLLEDLDLVALPEREALLERTAFFVANDLTDREPIILNAGFSGPGDGFVEAKGQPGFLPAGPWLVRGSELFAALDACGADGLGLELAVDGGEGFRERQRSTTARMILDPQALLARIAEEVKTHGARSAMRVRRADGVRDYPLAIEGSDGALRLPAGSIVLTGTPEGVALQAPSPLAVAWRGLLNLRGPFEQFRQEELARASAGERGGYLTAGDRVRARVDGLGTQQFEIAASGRPLVRDPCLEATEDPSR